MRRIRRSRKITGVGKIVVASRKSGQRRPTCDPVRGLIMTTNKKNSAVASRAHAVPVRGYTTEKGGMSIFVFFVVSLALWSSILASLPAEAAARLVIYASAHSIMLTATTDQGDLTQCDGSLDDLKNGNTVVFQEDGANPVSSHTCSLTFSTGNIDFPTNVEPNTLYEGTVFFLDSNGEQIDSVGSSHIQSLVDPSQTGEVVHSTSMDVLQGLLKNFFSSLLIVLPAIAGVLVALFGIGWIFSIFKKR
jgi:hypothetical protein